MCACAGSTSFAHTRAIEQIHRTMHLSLIRIGTNRDWPADDEWMQLSVVGRWVPLLGKTNSWERAWMKNRHSASTRDFCQSIEIVIRERLSKNKEFCISNDNSIIDRKLFNPLRSKIKKIQDENNTVRILVHFLVLNFSNNKRDTFIYHSENNCKG